MIKQGIYTSSSSKQTQSGTAGKHFVGIVLGFICLALMGWAFFPASFSTDLDRIGQGKPAIALVYDLEDGGSTNLMEGYTEIRDDYEGEIEFLVVDAVSPKGNAFMKKGDLTTGSAIYYSASGEKVMVIHGPQEISVLVDSINKAFKL